MNSVARGKTTIRVDLLKRTLCLMIAGIFTFTSTIGATHVESSFWSQRQEHINRSTIKSDASPILDLSSGVKGVLHELPDGSTVNFPANSGTVVETFQSASANPLVIHIQDVHNHPDAQLNEAFLIQSLLESSNFLPSLRGAERRSNLKDDDAQLLICIEGAKGIVPTRGLASLPDAEAKKEVAYSYLREGKINGEEYVALTQPADKITVYGVEDWNIYNANFAAREKVRQVSPAALAQVDNLLKQIKRAEAGKYSMELREFVSKRRAYHDQELELPIYLKYLTTKGSSFPKALIGNPDFRAPNISRVLKISQLESKLDSDKLEYSLKTFIEGLSEKLAKKEIESLLRKSLALRQGSISQSAYYAELFGLAGKNSMVIPGLLNEYREYQTLHSQLSYEKLMDEIDGLEENIANNLATTDEAKELLRYTDYVELLKDFWSLELTPKQWDKYKKEAHSNHPVVIASVAKQSHNTLPSPKPVEEYYKLAEARNETLAKNTLAAAKKYGVERTVLIAGGFHSDGMNKWFRSAGVPFVVIQPKLQKPGNAPQPMKITFVNDLAAAAKGAKAKSRGNIASFRDLENMLSGVLRSEMGMAIIGRTMLRAEDINILLKGKIGSKDVEFTGDIIKVDVDLGSYKDAYVFGKAKYQYSAGELITAPAIIYGSGREMKIAVGDEAVKVLLSGLSVSAAKQIKPQAQNIEAALGVPGITELISNSSIYSVKGMLKVIKNAPQTISKIIKLATERLPNLLVYSGLKDKYLGKAVKSFSGLINKDNWHRLLTKPAMVSAFAGFAVQMLVGIGLGLLSNAHAFGLYGENGLISWDNKNWVIGVPVALFGLFMWLKDRGYLKGRSRRSGGVSVRTKQGFWSRRFPEVSAWRKSLFPLFKGPGVIIYLRKVVLPEKVAVPGITYDVKKEGGEDKKTPKRIAYEEKSIVEQLKTRFFPHVLNQDRGKARGWISRMQVEQDPVTGKYKKAKKVEKPFNMPMDWINAPDVRNGMVQVGPDNQGSPNSGSVESVNTVVSEIKEFSKDLRQNNLRLKNVRDIVVIGMGGSSLGVMAFQSMLGNNWRNKTVRFLQRHAITRMLARFLIWKGFGSPYNVHVIDTTNPRSIEELEREIKAVEGKLALKNTLFIVSSKSGTTPETIGIYKHFKQSLREAYRYPLAPGDGQKSMIGRHFVAITEAGKKDDDGHFSNELEEQAEPTEYSFLKVFRHPYNIGGRYSALSVVGLLPAALMGINIDRLLDSANKVREKLIKEDPSVYVKVEIKKEVDGKTLVEEKGGVKGYSDAVKLGIAMYSMWRQGRTKMTFIMPEGKEYEVLGRWIEQLIAESLGKATETGQRFAAEKVAVNQKDTATPQGQRVGIVPVMGEPLSGETGAFSRKDKFFLRLNRGLIRNQNIELSRVLENSDTYLSEPTPVIDMEVRYVNGMVHDLGAFMYTMEVAVSVAGFLMDVNPFDEPGVDAYKNLSDNDLKKPEIGITQIGKERRTNPEEGTIRSLRGTNYNAGTPLAPGQYEGIDIDFFLWLLGGASEKEDEYLDNRWVKWEDIDRILESIMPRDTFFNYDDGRILNDAITHATNRGKTTLADKIRAQRILAEQDPTDPAADPAAIADAKSAIAGWINDWITHRRRENLAAVYASLLYLAWHHNAPHYREYAGLLPYLLENPGTEKLISNWRNRMRDISGMSTVAGYGPRFNHSLAQLFLDGPITGIFTIVRDFPLAVDKLTDERLNLHLEDVDKRGYRQDDSLGRRTRNSAHATAMALRNRGRATIMFNLQPSDATDDYKSISDYKYRITQLNGLFDEAFNYLETLMRHDGQPVPNANVQLYRGINFTHRRFKVAQVDGATRSVELADALNLALQRRFIRPVFGGGKYEIRVVENLKNDAIKQVNRDGRYILLDNAFVERILAQMNTQTGQELPDAPVYLLGEAVSHAMHHSDTIHRYDWREKFEEYWINRGHDRKLFNRYVRNKSADDGLTDLGRDVKALIQRAGLRSGDEAFSSQLRDNPTQYYRWYRRDVWKSYASKTYKFDHKASNLIPTEPVYAVGQEVNSLMKEGPGVSRADAAIITGNYNYMLSKFYGGSKRKFHVSLLREHVRTGRSYRNILLGIEDPNNRNPKKFDRNLQADIVRLGGGGMADTTLAKELVSGMKRRSLPARQEIEKMIYYVVTSAFDDGGHSGRMMQDIMDTLGEFIPAPGDPGGVTGWLTDHPALIDAVWGSRISMKVKPSDVLDQLEAVLKNRISGILMQKMPDFKETISLGNWMDIVENTPGFDESVRRQIYSATDIVKTYITSAEEGLKFELKIIYDKHFGSKDLPAPESWNFIVTKLLGIMRYWDDDFITQGNMNLIGVSVANLVYEYARKTGEDLNTMLGIYGGAVKNVSSDEATLAAVLEAHSVKIGSEIFLVRAKDGHLIVSPAEEVEPDTENSIERDPTVSRTIGTTRIQNVETWTINQGGTLEAIIAGKTMSFRPDGPNFVFSLGGVDYNGRDVNGINITNGVIANAQTYLFKVGLDKDKGNGNKTDVYLQISLENNGILKLEKLKGNKREGFTPIIDSHGSERIYNRNNGTLQIKVDNFHTDFSANGNDVNININNELDVNVSDNPDEIGKTIVRIGNTPRVIRTDALWDTHFVNERSSLTKTPLRLAFKSRLVEEQTFISDADEMLPASVEMIIFKKAKRDDGDDANGRWIYKTNQNNTPDYDRIGRKIREFRTIKRDEYPEIDSEVREKVKNAKVILLGLGSHFDSMLPNLMVNGMIDAILQAKDNGAHVVFIPKATMDIQSAGLTIMQQIKVVEDSINYMWEQRGELDGLGVYNPSRPFHFTDILTHVHFVDADRLEHTKPEFTAGQEAAWKKLADPETQTKIRTGQEKLSKIVSLGLNIMGFIWNPRINRYEPGVDYLTNVLGPNNVVAEREEMVEVLGSRLVYKPKQLKNLVNGHLNNAKLLVGGPPNLISAGAKSLLNTMASAAGYGLLGVVVGGVAGGYFDIGNANVFNIFGYAINALGMMAGLVPAGTFGFQAARIGWAISNAKAGHERGPGVLIPEFESAVDLLEPFFLNGNRIAARLPNGQIAVYKPSMKQLSLTEQYWYYYHEKVHGFFGRLPGQEAIVALTDFVTLPLAVWKAKRLQMDIVGNQARVNVSFRPKEIRQVTSKGVLKTALYFAAAAALTGIMAYLFGQDTGVVKLAIPIILATMGGGLGLVSSAIGKAESGRLGKPSPEQVRKVVAELSQRSPGVVIKEAEAGKGIAYEDGGDLYMNYQAMASLSPIVRQLIYSHEAMHLTNIPVVRSEFAAYLRLAIGLPVEIVKHHLKVMVSQTHARLGSDVKAGFQTLIDFSSFRDSAYPALNYKIVDINSDNRGIAERVQKSVRHNLAMAALDSETSKGVSEKLGEIGAVLPQVVGSYLAQIGLEVKGVAVNPAGLVSHYKSGEVPTLSAQVIVAGPSDMKPLLVDMDTQQLNSQLSFKFGEIKLTLLSDEFMKVHANDDSRNRELFVHINSMVSVGGASFANEEQGRLYGKAYVARARALYNEARRTLSATNKKILAAKVADVVAKLNELDFMLQAATGVDGIGIASDLKSLVREAMVTGKWAPSERMLGELKENMASAGKAIEAASRYVKLQNKLEGRVKRIMAMTAGLERKDSRDEQERKGPVAFMVDSPLGFIWTDAWMDGLIQQNLIPQIIDESEKGNLAIIPIVTEGDGEPFVFKADDADARFTILDAKTKKVVTAIADALQANTKAEMKIEPKFVLVPEEKLKDDNGLLNPERLHALLLHMPELKNLGLSREFSLHMYSPAMPGKGQRWIDIQKSYIQMFLMVTPITILNVGEHSKEAMEIYKMLAEQA